MSDAWLFWDPERLEAYPHSGGSGAEPGLPTTEGADSVGRSFRLEMFQDLLIYAAGIASALIGVALAVLVGSFISAYSVLSEASRTGVNAKVEHPVARVERTTVLADAAAVAARSAGSERHSPGHSARPSAPVSD